MASRKAAAIMAVVVVAALLPATASAEYYKVGGPKGWNPGVDYKAWAAGKAFKVGDTIVFLYSVGDHNVVLVDEATYNSCTLPIGVQQIRTIMPSGRTVTLG